MLLAVTNLAEFPASSRPWQGEAETTLYLECQRVHPDPASLSRSLSLFTTTFTAYTADTIQLNSSPYITPFKSQYSIKSASSEMVVQGFKQPWGHLPKRSKERQDKTNNYI
jgi:hypothetical protein